MPDHLALCFGVFRFLVFPLHILFTFFLSSSNSSSLLLWSFAMIGQTGGGVYDSTKRTDPVAFYRILRLSNLNTAAQRNSEELVKD